MACSSLRWKSYKSGPNDRARSSLIRVDEERLGSEYDNRRNHGNGAMFLEKSDLDGLQRLKLPKIIWSSAEQQFATNGLQGLEDSVLMVNYQDKLREDDQINYGC